MPAFTRRNALRGALAAGTAGLAVVSPAPALAGTQARQNAFAAAAEEFGVPESVLLGVSYLKSRWDHNGGRPSTSAGFGPMHLTDVRMVAAAGTHHDKGAEDPRGDQAREVLRPAPPAAADPSSSLQTVEFASQLTGVTPETLRIDPAQNIRGGAAVLAAYQEALSTGGADAADWYGAVARYSGATDATAAAFFADEVYATISSGAARTTDDGHLVTLAAEPGLTPNRRQLNRLGLPAGTPKHVEAPPGLACDWVPAPYQDLGNGNYGNYDQADRPYSQTITYVVIHDTECSYDTALALVQDPKYLGWHYTLRSVDGHVAQHIRTKDVGWHAGNWYVNAKSIGVEHEGYALQGTWYTEAMYRASAKLVRYLAARYDIPLDREHIIGHDNVPGITPAAIKGMHWDPAAYWDWAHYFELLGAPLNPYPPRGDTGLVMIQPDYAANPAGYTGCDTDNPAATCPAHGSSGIHLHTEPRADASLLRDPGLHPDGSSSTVDMSDVGSRMSAGQRFAVVDRQGDWTAVWFLGQKGWFHNPADAPAARPVLGWVVVVKEGLDTVPIYGRAYPEAAAYPQNVDVQDLVPLPYTFAAGQRYAAGPVLGSEYYRATTFDGSDHVVVRGKTRYVQIQFGHRVAYVKTDDVRIVSPRR
ncbi:N-acetylmuramoyl-L-alanine amidase [Amycolatopsis pigmentata]|uniref:N-acetylmuramoyl-L-alanine amidase n=1 Tax=Amycolatopsis pigmentata TaxID=450801 RepID=A0ABW5G613_9PSEU